VYDDRDLHEAVVLVRVVVLAAEIPAVMWGNPDRLPTSSVSNSSSPKLLDVVLLGGDCGVLRRAGAERRRVVYHIKHTTNNNNNNNTNNTRTMFMVRTSLVQSHCMNSPDSHDECRTAPDWLCYVLLFTDFVNH